MEAGLIWQVLLGAGGLFSAFLLVKFQTAQQGKDIESLKKDLNNMGEKNDRKIDAGFKRLDDVILKVTTLERDTLNHIDMPRAEERFVSKTELQLHLKNIEQDIRYIKEGYDSMGKKLDKLTDVLSNNIVKTLTPIKGVYGDDD